MEVVRVKEALTKNLLKGLSQTLLSVGCHLEEKSLRKTQWFSHWKGGAEKQNKENSIIL